MSNDNLENPEVDLFTPGPDPAATAELVADLTALANGLLDQMVGNGEVGDVEELTGAARVRADVARELLLALKNLHQHSRVKSPYTVRNMKEELAMVSQPIFTFGARPSEPDPESGVTDARIRFLEEGNLETHDRLAVIKSQIDMVASTEDMAITRVALQEAINSFTWKLVASVFVCGTALVTATYFVARSFH